MGLEKILENFTVEYLLCLLIFHKMSWFLEMYSINGRFFNKKVTLAKVGINKEN